MDVQAFWERFIHTGEPAAYLQYRGLLQDGKRSNMEHLTLKGLVIRENDFGDQDRYITVLTEAGRLY